MASSFVRGDSPVYYLRVKNPNGTWGKVRTCIRRDDPDGSRKLKMALGEAEAAEAKLLQAQGVEPEMRGWGWVAGYLLSHYDNPETLRRVRNCWAAVSVFLDYRGLTEPALITHAHGHDYVGWRQKPPAGTVKARHRNTALTEIKIWGGIMQHAVRCGMIVANPLYRLGIRRQRPKVKPEITLEEQAFIQEKLAMQPEWMQESFFIAMKQGCRRDQCCVPMKDIDTEEMTIRFPEQKGRSHTAPLHPDLLPLVERRRSEGAEMLVRYPSLVSGRWTKFFRQIRLPHICFHSTRVTVVTRLLRDDWTPALVMQYIGHSSELVNMIYRRLKAPDCAKLGRSL